MLADLSAFSAEDFDPKAWVNDTCASRPGDEPVEKYLSEMEMKLQLLAEDISTNLEDLSASSLLRVPRAVREINRVRDDAVSLRHTVTGILLRLEQAEGSSAQCVAALAKVDMVKQHMEAARDTLQDAAGLAQLSASVEEVFASGDLPKVAETLASMRKCLSVVGEVPEFADVKRQLAALEDRLEQMVQPRLSDALTQRNVEACQALRDILLAIGRFSALEQQYTRTRLRPIRKLWDDYAASGVMTAGNPKVSGADASSPSFPNWLSQFYDQWLLTIESELQWCSLAFPEHFTLLLPRMLMEAMDSIKSSFGLRLKDAVQEASSALDTLTSLHAMAAAFARNLHHLLSTHLSSSSSSSSPSSTSSSRLPLLLRAVYAPFDTWKQAYAELASAQLAADLAGQGLPELLRGARPREVVLRVGQPGGVGQEIADAVSRVESSLPVLMAALERCVERCISFTGGADSESLVRVLDDAMLAFLSQLTALLHSLRPLTGLDEGRKRGKKEGEGQEEGREEGGEEEEEEEEEEWAVVVQAVLQLLAVSESLGSRCAVFEASLRVTLSRLGEGLRRAVPAMVVEEEGAEGAEGGGGEAGSGKEERQSAAGVTDAAVLRLLDSPELAKRLGILLQQCSDPRFHTLPRASQRIRSFQDLVGDLVYDVLVSKVKRSLKGFTSKPVWSAKEEVNAFELPSFSSYPEHYITVIGEYLLQLPQQLEPLGGRGGGEAEEEEEEDEGSYFATEWMFKVAEGATALYTEQLKSLPSVSEKGASQLAADIEYLSNVLAALSMAAPPVLSTFQVCLAAPKDGLANLIASEAGPGGALDSTTARLVAKMRNVSLD